MPRPGQMRGGKKAKKPMKTLFRLMGLIFKSYWPLIIIVVICMALSAFASVFGAKFPADVSNIENGELVFFKDYTGTTDQELNSYILVHLLPLIIIYAIGVLAAYINARLMALIGQGMLKKVRDNMFNHMQDLPIVYFDRHPHGEIMSRFTNDTDTLRQLISQSIPMVIQSGLMMLFLLIYMIISNVILALVVIAMVIVMVFTTKILGGKSGKNFVKQQIDVGALNGYVEEMLSGIKVVKVFNHEEDSIKGFDEINNRLCKSSTKANIFASILMPVMNNLGYISYGVTIMVGSLLALNNVMGFGVAALVAYISYNRMFCNQVSQASNQFNLIILGIAGSERIFEVMDEKPEEDNGYVTLVNAKEINGEIVEVNERTGLWAWKHPHHDGTTTYTKLAGDVRFFDVDFGYYPDKIVLHNVSLFAKPGQKIAFVGSTGAGKTTITNLINRFYDIQDGKIRFDGININKIKKSDLRRALGMVLQDTNLFTGTIKENIRYGKLDATDEEVYEAARLANVDQFVKHLPNGYDTLLTENGSELSQGQRQLIAIARAAITNPPVLILDEATSSIDTRTEALVTSAMDKLMDGRTVFVIAHRLSTVKNSKAIMVLEHGNIIERGSHDELIENKGKYYQLYTGAFELE